MFTEVPTRVLDVAGGTGDIAFRIFNGMLGPAPQYQTPPALESMTMDAENVPLEGSGIIVSDINKNMLRVGQRRSIEKGLAGSKAVYF